MRAKDAVGQHGERLAARFLASAGFTMLDRNWRCSGGEIDIIAQERDVFVFCEVKTRSGLGFGQPAEAVTRAKADRIRGLAMQWLAAHRQPYREVRFDVVSVVVHGRAAVAIEHVRGAF